MKIEIESTEKIVAFNGVKARIWEGRTASGIPVHCYVTRIAVFLPRASRLNHTSNLRVSCKNVASRRTPSRRSH